MRTEVVSSDDEIARIAPAWDAFAAEFGSPINSAVWHRHALRHAHGPADRPHIVTVWRNERLTAIAPLILAQRTAGRRVEIIGAETLFEPSAVLANSVSAAEALVSAVLATGRPVKLTRLAATAFNMSLRKLRVVQAWLYARRRLDRPLSIYRVAGKATTRGCRRALRT